ncbi:MAG: glycosyltransferase, partial [Bacteroidetes bacterium]|nr:glycosyltransferase [Bacteroidota bacterium]
MSQRFKVLFLSSWYPSRINPQLGNFVQRHAKAASIDNDVAVLHVCADPSISNTYEVVESNDDGIHTVIVYYKKSSGFKRLTRYFKAYRSGLERIRSSFGKIDLIHVNVLFPVGVIALWFKWLYKIPYVVTEHWTGYLQEDGHYSSSSFLRKMMTQKVVSGSSMILPVTNNLATAMQSLGLNAKYQVITNVVNTDLFKPATNGRANSTK